MTKIEEFTRGCIRVSIHQREVAIVGEMILDPLGFVVYDDLPLRWSDDAALLSDRDRDHLFVELAGIFAAKGRRLWFRSDAT